LAPGPQEIGIGLKTCGEASAEIKVIMSVVRWPRLIAGSLAGICGSSKRPYQAACNEGHDPA
jgi:hypothetical protein